MDQDDAHTEQTGRHAAGRDGSGDTGPPGVPGRSGGPGDLRVGDSERSAALEALGEHLAAGRLDVDEFGDRSARASVAVRRSDLEVLFTDLPAPHPPLPRAPVPEPAVRAQPVPPPPAPWQGHPASAAPFVGLGLAMLLLLVLPGLLIGAATTGGAGGLIVIPLLFLALGHARHGRWHGRGGPGGHRGPGGPRDRW